MSKFDLRAIWTAVLMLITIGLIMIYSASSTKFINSEMHGYDSMYLLKRQAMFAVMGLVVCIVLQYVNYSVLYRVSISMYVGGIGMILLLKTPLGVAVNGAMRWINVLGIQFQVAEFLKISVIVILAYMIQHYPEHLSKIEFTAFIWGVGGFAGTLLLFVSNDLSSSLVIFGVTYCISFIYTRNEKFHIAVAALLLIAFSVYVLKIKNNMPTAAELDNMSFRVGRIAAWLDPERYASGQGYQTLQALYAIGSGGFWGKGLGNSTQKIRAIPEGQNDMIFSIICEELGGFGALLIMFLIGYLCWEIVVVSSSAKNLFGSVLATGVFVHIFLQSFFNIGVNVNLLPNTGIGLPFISYGGTAVLCQLLEIAMVLSVGRVADGKKTINLYKWWKNRRVKIYSSNR